MRAEPNSQCEIMQHELDVTEETEKNKKESDILQTHNRTITCGTALETKVMKTKMIFSEN